MKKIKEGEKEGSNGEIKGGEEKDKGRIERKNVLSGEGRKEGMKE